MKFQLYTSGTFYRDDEIAKLESIGFKFEPSTVHWNRRLTHKKKQGGIAIEIPTLEKLMELSKEWGPLIVTADDASIEIYDNYRE